MKSSGRTQGRGLQLCLAFAGKAEPSAHTRGQLCFDSSTRQLVRIPLGSAGTHSQVALREPSQAGRREGQTVQLAAGHGSLLLQGQPLRTANRIAFAEAVLVHCNTGNQHISKVSAANNEERLQLKKAHKTHQLHHVETPAAFCLKSPEGLRCQETLCCYEAANIGLFAALPVQDLTQGATAHVPARPSCLFLFSPRQALWKGKT